MKTTKYILSSLCLAALAAGCTKDTGMRTSSVEGLRISVTATTPSTRTSLHEDGLSLLWEEGDQLQLIPTNADNDNIYTLTLDEKSLSSDGTQADFVASQAIPEGEYYLASSNAKPGLESDPHTITFLYSDSKDAAASNITVTDATKNTHEGGLKTMALLSDKFAVSADDTEILTSLKHYSTLLELPILLTSNTTGADITLNKITLEASVGKISYQHPNGLRHAYRDKSFSFCYLFRHTGSSRRQTVQGLHALVGRKLFGFERRGNHHHGIDLGGRFHLHQTGTDA